MPGANRTPELLSEPAPEAALCGLRCSHHQLNVELRPESRNTAHKVLELDLAKHILAIDGGVVGAPISGLDDTSTTMRNNHRSTS